MELWRPAAPEIKEPSQLLVDNRESEALLEGISAVVDGGQFCCDEYVDANPHHAYYESYTQAEEVTNLLFYNFKGKLVHAPLNFPAHGTTTSWRGYQD